MVSEDIILFSVLGIVVVYSCALHMKRCRRERRRVAALVATASELASRHKLDLGAFEDLPKCCPILRDTFSSSFEESLCSEEIALVIRCRQSIPTNY